MKVLLFAIMVSVPEHSAGRAVAESSHSRHSPHGRREAESQRTRSAHT